jgi:hypothetical protein
MCVFKNHAFIYFLRPPSWSGTVGIQFRVLLLMLCSSGHNKPNLNLLLSSYKKNKTPFLLTFLVFIQGGLRNLFELDIILKKQFLGGLFVDFVWKFYWQRPTSFQMRPAVGVVRKGRGGGGRVVERVMLQKKIRSSFWVWGAVSLLDQLEVWIHTTEIGSCKKLPLTTNN